MIPTNNLITITALDIDNLIFNLGYRVKGGISKTINEKRDNLDDKSDVKLYLLRNFKELAYLYFII